MIDGTVRSIDRFGRNFVQFFWILENTRSSSALLCGKGKMLQTASHVFLQAIGRGHFHKIRSSDDMDDAQILHLATRKRHFCWSSSRFSPQEYEINDILEGPALPEFPVESAVEFKDFQTNTDCKISGKVGASLASVMNLSISALESISFNLPLGQVNKKSLDVCKLVSELQGRKVNLSHPLVKQCVESKTGISIIVETLCLSKDVEIVATANFKDEASVKESNKVLPASATVDYDRSRCTKVSIFSGKPLVFRCLDLQIDLKTGTFRCRTEGLGRHSYFCCGNDTTDNQGEDCLQPAELKPFFELSNDRLSQLRAALLKFCDKPMIVHGLREEFLGDKQAFRNFPEADRTAWEELVKAAEHETSAAEVSVALSAIFESLVSVPDEALLQLPLLSLEEARALLHSILPQVVHSVEISGATDGKLLQHSAACTEIAKVLKLRFQSDGSAESSGDQATVEAFARVLFVLFPLHN